MFSLHVLSLLVLQLIAVLIFQITIIVLHCLVNMEEFAVTWTMITAADVHRPISGNLAKFVSCRNLLH